MPTIWRGTLKKMRVEASEPVSYFVRDGYHDPGKRSEELPLNPLLGHQLALRFVGTRALHGHYSDFGQPSALYDPRQQ